MCLTSRTSSHQRSCHLIVEYTRSSAASVQWLQSGWSGFQMLTVRMAATLFYVERCIMQSRKVVCSKLLNVASRSGIMMLQCVMLMIEFLQGILRHETSGWFSYTDLGIILRIDDRTYACQWSLFFVNTFHNTLSKKTLPLQYMSLQHHLCRLSKEEAEAVLFICSFPS